MLQADAFMLFLYFFSICYHCKKIKLLRRSFQTKRLILGAEESCYLPWQAMLDQPERGEASGPDPVLVPAQLVLRGLFTTLGSTVEGTLWRCDVQAKEKLIIARYIKCYLKWNKKVSNFLVGHIIIALHEFERRGKSYPACLGDNSTKFYLDFKKQAHPDATPPISHY